MTLDEIQRALEKHLHVRKYDHGDLADYITDLPPCIVLDLVRQVRKDALDHISAMGQCVEMHMWKGHPAYDAAIDAETERCVQVVLSYSTPETSGLVNTIAHAIKARKNGT